MSYRNQKEADNSGEIFHAKAFLRNYLKEKCKLEQNQQLFFKYFVELFLIPELLLNI